MIGLFKEAACYIADKVQASKDQFNFCYNAIREHTQNIDKYCKQGKVGFFVYQEGFFDKVVVDPEFNHQNEIWSRRANIKGDDYISVYFYKFSAFKSNSVLQHVFANTPQSIKGVDYGSGEWKQSAVKDGYYNCDRYGYVGKNWKSLGREDKDVDQYGAHYKYHTVLGYGYSFGELREHIPEGKCEIY